LNIWILGDEVGEKHELVMVMPIYNEEGCIQDVVNSWHDELMKLQIDFKMILLNDGSNDCTKEKLNIFEQNGRILVINKTNSGHGPTILMGYNIAVQQGVWIFQTDSDDEMKPDCFIELWRRRSKYSALFGMRSNRQQNVGRKIISIISRATVSFFFCRGVTDVNTPYRLIKAICLKPIIYSIPDDTFAPNVIISGALATSGTAILNFPVPHEIRNTGSVSIVQLKLWKAVIKSFLQTVSYWYFTRLKASK
jgi:dolichol-phosphate mannosyltransferase